ncbi:hypothetical protein RIF29_17055 [Crotalaria pallida]|uniref:Uncharacterized protein n=1 Tax=Crotalaria pallida TaxID=3830 RepID=A0AAN9FPU3_CROPI
MLPAKRPFTTIGGGISLHPLQEDTNRFLFFAWVSLIMKAASILPKEGLNKKEASYDVERCLVCKALLRLMYANCLLSLIQYCSDSKLWCYFH